MRRCAHAGTHTCAMLVAKLLQPYGLKHNLFEPSRIDHFLPANTLLGGVIVCSRACIRACCTPGMASLEQQARHGVCRRMQQRRMSCSSTITSWCSLARWAPLHQMPIFITGNVVLLALRARPAPYLWFECRLKCHLLACADLELRYVLLCIANHGQHESFLSCVAVLSSAAAG